MQTSVKKAIKSALDRNWKEAVEHNLTILNENPNDIPTLNRLARAYTELAQIDKAKETYSKVIKLDKYNPITTKNLKRLKVKDKNSTIVSTVTQTPIIHTNFLEEPGKTKTSQLVRLSEAQMLANLQIGQSVQLEAKKRLVSVLTEDGTYIGSLPDNLSFILGKLIRSGNKYEAIIKSLEKNAVQVFIRETHRSGRFKNIPSFPTSTTSSYYSDIRRAVIKEDPIDIRETGEQEDNQ